MRRHWLSGLGVARKTTRERAMKDRAPGRDEKGGRRLGLAGHHDASQEPLPELLVGELAAAGKGLEHDAGFQELAADAAELHLMQRFRVAGIEDRPRRP